MECAWAGGRSGSSFALVVSDTVLIRLASTSNGRSCMWTCDRYRYTVCLGSLLDTSLILYLAHLVLVNCFGSLAGSWQLRCGLGLHYTYCAGFFMNRPLRIAISISNLSAFWSFVCLPSIDGVFRFVVVAPALRPWFSPFLSFQWVHGSLR